jgi:hypothetical protein
MRIAFAHIVLLLLVTAEYPDLSNLSIEKTLEYRTTEGTRASGDQYLFIRELIHFKQP